MSVNTEADKKLRDAKDHIDDAIDDMFEIVMGKVWGWDDFNVSYQMKLRQTLQKLIDVKLELL